MSDVRRGFSWGLRYLSVLAIRMLQETLAYVRTQHWDKKRRRWEPTLLPAPKGRKPLGPELRFDVLARDGHACRYCGRTAPDVPLHVDHIIPRSKGGTDDPSNLVTACQDCNLGKSDRVLV